jgi:histidine triad (HIT) family protein
VSDVTNDCLFCRIVKKEIPANIVAENDHCLAFRDINPQAPVHILVIPRVHVASLDEAKDADIIGRMHLMAARLARSEGVAKRGYRVVVNTNADGGQTVFHIHLHLLGGRRMAWPPG